MATAFFLGCCMIAEVLNVEPFSKKDLDCVSVLAGIFIIYDVIRLLYSRK